jgi:pSer/pThr/pTyr-binding forkhead associated (FHA) protein
MLGVMKPCTGGDPIPLLKRKLLIGRHRLCDFRLRFADVSSRHCELEFKNGLWYARDLGSANGTFVNGRICQYECIKPGSVLAIGPHRFALEYEDKAEPRTGQRLDDQTVAIAAEQRSAKAGRHNHGGRLLPLGGGSPIALTQNQMLVGRDHDCDIVLPLNTVSARHCELQFARGHWLVRDLGSRNGTKVDGKKIKQTWLLPNCKLQISTLRFKVLYQPTPGAPVPSDEGVSATRILSKQTGRKPQP